jgi:acyl carrier protein
MNPTKNTLPIDSEAFAGSLLHFINEQLPQLDRRGRTWDAVGTDTLLFESGRLDSLSILHLIGHLEELTGHSVPDHLVVMKHFRSIEAMTAAFCQSPKP